MTLGGIQRDESGFEAAGWPLRVLLVEDSEYDALLLLRELRRGGYEPVHERVFSAGGMERAIEEAEAREEPWEVVISDYRMPGFEAPEAIALLRRLGCDTPLIVVSGKVGEEAVVEAVKAGAHDYVAKDNLARLNSAVGRGLRESEERRERERAERERDRFFGLSLDLLCIADLDGFFTRVNPAFGETLGYPEEEMLARPFADFVHPDDLAATRGEMARLAAGATTVNFENRYRRRDGSYAWLSWKAVPVPEEGIVYAVARDVTERRRAEEELRASEIRYRTMIEQSPLSTQVLSPEGRTLRVNRAWEELWGLTLEDLADYNMLEDPQLVEKGVMPHLRKGFAGEPAAIPAIAYDPEETLPGRSGHEEPVRWVTGFVYPVKDDDGTVREVVLVHEDVTERVRAEEAVKTSEERFRAAFEQAAVGMSQVAPDGSWMRVNGKLCEITGYGRDELLSMTFKDITHPEDLDEDLRLLERLKRGEIGSYSMEKRYVRKDNSVIWINLTVSAARGEDGRPAYCVAVTEDITERKRAEEALSEVREAERARLARELHDGVLQDLTYVAAAMEVMKIKTEGPGIEGDLERQIGDIRRAVGGLREAVYDLRGHSEQSAEQLLESLVELTRQRAPELDVRLETRPGILDGLPGRAETELLRIVQEALTNARRHSGAARVRVALDRSDGEVRIEVEDDGRGFDPEAPPGVGLRSMRERTRALDGALEVESEPGKGTRLKVRVPVPR